MSFTRFHDDPARIQKQLEEWTFSGRYQLNVPGPGIDLPFQEDPHLRLQKWGANLRKNTINLESDLFGLSKTINRDPLDESAIKRSSTNPSTSMPNYPLESPFVEESRASHPAWMFRDAVQPRWDYPMINPQALNQVEKAFHDNVQTRILEKDYYIPRVSTQMGL